MKQEGKVNEIEGYLKGSKQSKIEHNILKFAEVDGKSVSIEVWISSHSSNIILFEKLKNEKEKEKETQHNEMKTDWRINNWKEDKSEDSIIQKNNVLWSKFCNVAWRRKKLKRSMWRRRIDVDMDMFGIVVGNDCIGRIDNDCFNDHSQDNGTKRKCNHTKT